MCQYNVIITKTPAAAACLEKLGFYLAYPLQHDYSAWCWGMPEITNCGSMVGAYWRELKEKGTYPETLGHADYRQAFQKWMDHVKDLERQFASGCFSEDVAEFLEKYQKYSKRLDELSAERLRYSKWRIGEPGEEEIALREAYAELMTRDPLLFAAASLEKEKAKEYLLLRRVGNRDAREFRHYRRIFSRILKVEECVYFTHIWNQPGDLKLVNTLPLNRLRVSDLALLAQDDVIRIGRREE